MKRILYILALIVLSFGAARAQYPTLYLDNVTTTYGTLSVSTVGTGGVFVGGGASCFPGSGVNAWWIGFGTSGGYVHTFSRPVYRIMIPDWALNGGATGVAEYKQFSINGAPYPLSPAEMISNTTTCPSSGPNPCYVSGGNVWGPLGTSANYNGDTVMIVSTVGINSIGMYCGNANSGDVYIMYVDTVAPVTAIANTPCVLDTLLLGDKGDSSNATYKWTGPHGFTSTLQYPFVYPSKMSDTGLYTVIRTNFVANVHDTDSVYVHVNHCSTATQNDPCEGSALWLYVSGDSVGMSYKWAGPHGFSSTLHHPSKFPAMLSDTGMYYVYRSIAGVSDTDSVRVVVHSKLRQTLTDNAPMCANTLDTLLLRSTPSQPGATYEWTGPNGFTSTLQFPQIDNFIPADTGFYTSVSITAFGCRDTSTVHAGLVDPPQPPAITGRTPYCQNDPAGASLSAVTVPAGSPGTIRWDTLPVASMRLASAPSIAAVGFHRVYATTTSSFGCESARDTFDIHVITTPPKPIITTGVLDYCQHIGPFTPVTVSMVHTNAVVYWWTVSIGGTSSLSEPTVDVNITGPVTYYVSQKDSGCMSDRTPVVTTIHPQPAPPTIVSDSICQFWPATARVATASGSGDIIRWFVPPDTIGTLTSPIPVTLVPGLYEFYANELSSFGCLSDKSKGTIYVKTKPAPPAPHDTTYCQYFHAPKLTADSVYGGYLKWYILGKQLSVAPVPSNTKAGDSTWYVSEVIDGCESDSLPMKVTTIYKPQFSIEASSPFVCQFDSVRFAYKGPSLFDAKYSWGIPPSSIVAHGSEGLFPTQTDSFIYLRFDSVVADNYIHLHVTDDHGFCAGDTSFRIKIVEQPYAKATSKNDVCVNEQASLALGVRGSSAADFNWLIDNVPMDKSNALNIVAHNSSSGGPFTITWNDSGRHEIQLVSRSVEGCASMPTVDTINVHSLPDAGFTYMAKNSSLCLEDSILFSANANNYNYAYVWSPDHFFSNVNKPQLYGRVELAQSTVSLQVTDPFGCVATTSQTLTPGECCRVSFPTAFLPNGGNKNTIFRPIYMGYHRFSSFRIANRWGQTVFESTNNGMSWDGTYNGVPQDAGVYFYYIKYDCGGKSMEQTGDVTLIR